MVHEQITPSGSNKKIRSAIDSLLTSQSTQVVNSDIIKLTICSPDIEVVMNKQGGICTKCNTMFKSRSSLLSHLEKCGIKLSSTTSEIRETPEKIKNDLSSEIHQNFSTDFPRLKLDIVTPSTAIPLKVNRPKLIIVL